MEFSVQAMIFAFLGGLGLFLFGIRFMSEGLQSVAGDRMRSILEKGTKNPVRGVLTGTVVTALIQSSSATTVLTVGLVNAGLLSLRQAIGVIMGANIGTTVTAFLIGFNLKDYALPILAVGALIYLFAREKRNQLIGQSIFGFGALFFGLTIMGEGMQPLKDLQVFTDLMVSIEDKAIIGVLVGMIFTFIIQSSSATIGVLQELAYQGAVTYQQAVPILFGDNIGTTITALLAGLGAGVAARRASLTHFLFNLTGTLIFLPLFLMGFFEKMVVWVTNTIFIFLPTSSGVWEAMNIKLQLAQTHAVFNISNALIHLPLVAVLAAVVTWLIPGREDEDPDQYRTKYIDSRFLRNPSVALTQATREMIRMGELAREMFHLTMDYFRHRDNKLVQRAKVLEETIDKLEREITDFVVSASQKNLSRDDSNQAYVILQSLNDIERIADLCENIMEEADYAARYQVSFSGEAQEELDRVISLTGETLDLALQVISTRNKELAKQVDRNERKIDELQAQYRKEHIKRLNDRVCNGNNGAVYLDVLGNLERISDHCRNITGYMFPELYEGSS